MAEIVLSSTEKFQYAIYKYHHQPNLVYICLTKQLKVGLICDIIHSITVKQRAREQIYVDGAIFPVYSVFGWLQFPNVKCCCYTTGQKSGHI